MYIYIEKWMLLAILRITINGVKYNLSVKWNNKREEISGENLDQIGC